MFDSCPFDLFGFSFVDVVILVLKQFFKCYLTNDFNVQKQEEDTELISQTIQTLLTAMMMI